MRADATIAPGLTYDRQVAILCGLPEHDPPERRRRDIAAAGARWLPHGRPHPSAPSAGTATSTPGTAANWAT